VLRQFIADYNRRFARQPREKKPRGVLLRKSSIVSAAWCTSAWLVRQRRAMARPTLPDSQQARRFSFAGAKVQIYQALNGRVTLYYGDARLEHSAIPGG